MCPAVCIDYTLDIVVATISKWFNGVLEYEGNECGDTSTFYFVGQLVW